MTLKVIATLALISILIWGSFRLRANAQNAESPRQKPQVEAKPRTAQVISTSPAARLANAGQFTFSRDTSAIKAASSIPTGAASTAGVDDVAEIVVDSGKQYQKVVGFGGAFTDAACYMFDQLSAEARSKVFDDLFSPKKLGLNLCRVAMGSSDYATHAYSYCDGEPDPEMKRFSIAHDRKYILPTIKEALAINPDIFLFASPWSPPGWMKSNNSMLGGNMRREYMPAYAIYFTRFVQDYAKSGVPIKAVTIQNEVDTDQDGRMPACAWPQEYEVDFVRHHLGPAFKANGIDTQIWIIDHNYNLWGRALGSLDTEGLKDYVKAIAWHGYVGDAHRMTTVHDAYPDVDMYWTEGGPDYTDPNYALDWTKWSRTFTGNLRNWCRGITVWNLALDDKGRPNIGPFPCGGLVTIHSETKEVSLSGQYFALAHFSKYVKRDATVIKTEGSADNVAHVAFVNPDGTKVMVVTNSGAARTVVVRDGDDKLSLNLEADSVNTVIW